MRIDALHPDGPVDVSTETDHVVLAIGIPGAARHAQAALSCAQAEMVLHALGLAAAGLRDRAGQAQAERAALAERLLDQEFRRT